MPLLYSTFTNVIDYYLQTRNPLLFCG
jgi:hypothetical protein